MDSNSARDTLLNIFESLAVTDEINDELNVAIISFLMALLEKNDNDFFNDILFYNLILLLKQKKGLSYLGQSLVKEIELKSLRLQYTVLINNETLNLEQQSQPNQEETALDEEDLPLFKDKRLWPKDGYDYCRAQMRKRINGEDWIYVYRIDKKGQAVQFIEKRKDSLRQRDLDNFNNSPMGNIYSKNIRTVEENQNNKKVTENDL